jgi:hypothetical protein
MKKRGGYREGSGRAKTGYYKGVYCGSTYELIWVIYQFDHGIEFSRFEGVLEYNGKRYYPDFLQNGKIVEIKGYEDQKSVDKKTEVANKNGYEVIILRKESLKREFEWVKSNYKYSKVFELYDDYKPTYNLICHNCKISFCTDKKQKTTEVFCSRTCCGKYRKVINKDKKVTYNRKFSKDQIISIYNDPRSLSIIASDFGVSKGFVGFVKNKQTYKWVFKELTSHDAAGVATWPSPK